MTKSSQFHRSKRGTTLVEVMITLGILGILFSVGPNLLENLFSLWKTSEARVDIQKDARITLHLVQGLLRRASASTIIITRQSANDPPYSKIQFDTPDSHRYQFYQSGNDLWYLHQYPATSPTVTHNRVLVKNLRFITFGFPQITEDSLLSVAVCFEKATYSGKTKDFYLSTQRVQVMNS